MEKRRRTSKVDMANLRTRVWYQILESLEDYERELCSTEVFNFAFGVWRDAAKKCNLQFRKGHIYTGNNRMEFPYIYLPENLVFLPNDTGGVAALAYEGYWIRADYLGRKDGYRLHRVCRQKGTVLPDEIFENLEEHMQFVRSMEEKNEVARSKTRCITKTTFKLLIETYTEMLGRKSTLGKPIMVFSGWHMDAASSKPSRYWICEDTILDQCPDEPLRILQNPCHLDSPLSSILFCATIFSISKPLLAAAKLPTEFLLYLTARNVKNFEKRYDYLHHWICYYCNPNDCTNIKKDSHFERHDVGFLSPTVHHNFPVLYRIEDPTSKYFETFMEKACFTKKQAEKMKMASALPILLYPVKSSKKNEFKESLTLDVPIGRNDIVFHKKTGFYRAQLFDFYSGFINYLNEAPEERILQAKRFFSQALAELYCTKKSASDKQKQIACFLTAIYLVEEYIKPNHSARFDAFLKTKMLLKSLVVQRTASEVDFAEFLQGLIHGDGVRSPLLLQDDEYLYLNFKTYWNAFDDYCQRKNVLIQESGKEFRRKYLVPEFLKPQYVAKAGTYPRYDCRKCIGSKKETVLTVKKTILQYAKSSAN